jgi:membrane-associated phospholipid phosphatase
MNLSLKNRRTYQVATVISRLSDPFLIYSLIAFTGFFISPDQGRVGKLTLILFILVMIATPFVLLAWAVAKGKVSNWYITNRQERPLALLVLIFLSLIDMLVILRLGFFDLFGLFRLFSAWLIGFFGITLFWKVSGHTSSFTLASLLFTYWFGWPGFVLAALVPLIAWARVVRGDHTLSQTIGGVVYSAAVVFASLKFGIFPLI